MSKRAASISDQLRHAIESAGVTRYRIAKEVGVSEAALSRFMSGERGLTLSTLDGLAAYLGLTLSKRDSAAVRATHDRSRGKRRRSHDPANGAG